jgi:hypothetical protein
MALLRDIKLRQFMERNAVEFIFQDHFTDTIEIGRIQPIPSSLANLSVAITQLAGHSPPLPSHSLLLFISRCHLIPSHPHLTSRAPSVERLWPQSQLVNPLSSRDNLNNEFCKRAEVEKDNSLSLLSWAECQCLSLSQPPHSSSSRAQPRPLLLPSSTYLTRPFCSTTLPRVRNVSSPCLYRMSNEILLRYLLKRHTHLFQSLYLLLPSPPYALSSPS